MKGVSEHLLASLHPLELKVIPHLKEGTTLSALCVATGMQEVEVMRALQWLENKKALTLENDSKVHIHLDINATKALSQGMPEMRFLKAVQEGANTNTDIAKQAKLDPQEIGASIGLLRKAHLIDVAKDNTISVTPEGKKINTAKDETVVFLQKIEKTPLNVAKLNQKEQELLTALKNRKEYITLKEKKDRIIHLTDIGKELSKTDFSKHDFADRLTSEDLKTGAWKEKKYRAYDVSINVPKIPAGKEHFVQEAIEYIKSIWVEMGFVEHDGAIVQTAFWDLDALFVPQDHPAREQQDTFYLENPEHGVIDRKAFERVRDAHENGGTTGSKGWRYKYSKEEAEKLLLRTHDTVFSAQTLWLTREGKAKIPGKYFAVSKVFRNEKADWKHLFEFHQIGGIVVDKEVTFAQLIGYLKIFFAKMGFPAIRLRPHHFPYTEPSVEVDVWNPRKKQWVELGGAGVFRPEVTKTLIGEEVPVLAWGLGLERIVVEYFGLTDLRDIYGNDIKQLREMKRFVKIEEGNAIEHKM
jgi:phenylalanyl-tRNA synthetase alpha chain